MSVVDPSVPTYRYFTVDLVSNEILAEIPFTGVGYERALKGAGGFEGSISISNDTESLNIYDNTLPGKVGLYVVRDDKCVWGGIIWSRSYDVVSKKLSVHASEFTSYFQHRRIWKTWNNNYTADLVCSGGIITATINDGMTYTLNKGATVHIIMSEVQYFTYNGYYELLSDSVQNPYTQVVTAQMSATSTATPILTPVTMPTGSYPGVSIAIRTNTYDYVRSLIEAVSKDFYGTQFANTEIEPGKTDTIALTNRNMSGGLATVTTSTPHNVVPGQEFRLENVGSIFDGYHLATAVTSNTISYEHGGYIAPEAMSATKFRVTSRAISNKIATVTMDAAHSMYVGQKVVLTGVDNPDTNGSVYDGKVTVTSVSADNLSFSYNVGAAKDELKVALNPPLVTSGSKTTYLAATSALNNLVTISTATPHGFGANGTNVTVNVTGVKSTASIIGKELVRNVMTFTTLTPHGFDVGNPVTISGVGDLTNILDGKMSIVGTTATFTVTTAIPHNLQKGNTVTIANVSDTYSITDYSYHAANTTAVFTTSGTHNIAQGDGIEVSGISSRVITATNIQIANNQVTITTSEPHGFLVNKNVVVTGYPTTKVVVITGISKLGSLASSSGPSVVHATAADLGTLKVGDYITPAWTNMHNPNFASTGSFKVTLIDAKNKSFLYDDGIWYSGVYTGVSNPGNVQVPVDYGVNGTFTVGSVSGNTFTYYSGSAVNTAYKPVTGLTASAENPLNAKYDSVTAVTSTTFSVQSAAFAGDKTQSGLSGKALVESGIFNGSSLIVTDTPSSTKVSYQASVLIYTNLRTNATSVPATGTAVVLSPLFNVTDKIITTMTDYTFSIALSPGQSVAVDTSAVSPYGLATSDNILTGHNISATVVDASTLSYTKTGAGTVKYARVFGYATGESTPAVIYGTYGGYINNSSIDFEFSTNGYSATQTLPADLRGYEAKNVGEELDRYSDVINGFEYRVDCSYDENLKKFKRTFVLLPIFPDSLVQYLSSLPGGVLYLGESAPPSAFGADKYVFEFPGNINTVQIEESAENSATRFFMTGNLGFGGSDISQPYSVATATDLLHPTNGTMTKWPLLDDSHADSEIYDETVLYNYAKRYLAEAKPPDAKVTVEINGSITPQIGTYSPGDWCTLVIHDDFISQRLKNDLEPRSDVLIRKIDAIHVSVPDGVTYPEKISLTLVPEWQADQIGK